MAQKNNNNNHNHGLQFVFPAAPRFIFSDETSKLPIGVNGTSSNTPHPSNTRVQASPIVKERIANNPGEVGQVAPPQEPSRSRQSVKSVVSSVSKTIAAYCEQNRLRIIKGHEGDLALFGPVYANDKTFLHYYRFECSLSQLVSCIPQATGLIDMVGAECYDRRIIPRYEYNNTLLAFNNGVFFLESGQFIKHSLLPDITIARRGFDCDLDSTFETPLFDALLVSPTYTEYAKIGNAIRGTKNKCLFIIGGYDARQPIHNAIYESFHVADSDNVVHYNRVRTKAGLKNIQPPTKSGRRCAHIPFYGFEDRLVNDAVLRAVTIAEGSKLPMSYNTALADVIEVHFYGGWVAATEFVKEYSSFIFKAVACSLFVDGAVAFDLQHIGGPSFMHVDSLVSDTQTTATSSATASSTTTSSTTASSATTSSSSSSSSAPSVVPPVRRTRLRTNTPTSDNKTTTTATPTSPFLFCNERIDGESDFPYPLNVSDMPDYIRTPTPPKLPLSTAPTAPPSTANKRKRKHL